MSSDFSARKVTGWSTTHYGLWFKSKGGCQIYGPLVKRSKTLAFHAGDEGSTPLRITNFNEELFNNTKLNDCIFGHEELFIIISAICTKGYLIIRARNRAKIKFFRKEEKL